ncbi:hypothetical protein D3C73_640950 [compost metagenome]
MNPFEKIFNYQIISRLEDSGTFMVTAHERSWLKTMLQHPAAAEAFTQETLAKLQRILEIEQPLDMSELFMEKARSLEKQVYHPHLRTLRRIIANHHAVRLNYSLQEDRVNSVQVGYPYKLEYSMVKKEWYLLWYQIKRRVLVSTKLQKIADIQEESITEEQSAVLLAEIQAKLELRKGQATIQVIQVYNRELSRILYAFSCFEKEINYESETDTYTIRLSYAGNEIDYVLSKVRFLGKRVRVVESEQLRQRMYETTRKALARYDTGLS